MDTKGHARIGGDSPKPLLREALIRMGRRGWRVEAVSLGNWLTDVTVPVDPVVYASFRRNALDLMDHVVSSVRQWTDQAPARIRTWLTDVFDAIREYVEQAAGTLEGGRDSQVAQGFKFLFRFVGYFKFVHPYDTLTSSPHPRSRMDYQQYLAIFNDRYVQYYPHEHLDRYPARLSGQDSHNGYSATRASATRTPEGRGTGRSSLSPHMYTYLVDAIEMAAGLLADVDLNWGRYALACTGSAGPANDADPQYNQGLAKLGHVLHLVEDFFAHTNFLELALTGMSEADRRNLLPVTDDHRTLPWLVIHRRLKRYSGTSADRNEDLNAIPDEDHVVSGCFDMVDTFFSVRHIGEDIFQAREESQLEREQTDWQELLLALFRDILVQVQRELPADRQVTRDQARQAARTALQRMARREGLPLQVAADHMISHAPQEVQDDFYTAVGVFAAHAANHMSIFDAFRFFHDMAEWLNEPVEFVRWALRYVSHRVDRIDDWIREQVINALEDVLSPWNPNWRIGTHSLIAKDYITDHEDLTRLYRNAMNLAKAMDWYIVKTLCRWSEPAPMDVSLRDSDAAGDDQSNTADNPEFVDWLELLESFLRHPHRVSEPHWWAPVVRGDWTHLDGYNALDEGRCDDLPHTLVSATEDEVQELIDRRERNLRTARQRYA